MSHPLWRPVHTKQFNMLTCPNHWICVLICNERINGDSFLILVGRRNVLNVPVKMMDKLSGLLDIDLLDLYCLILWVWKKLGTEWLLILWISLNTLAGECDSLNCFLPLISPIHSINKMESNEIPKRLLSIHVKTFENSHKNGNGRD